MALSAGPNQLYHTANFKHMRTIQGNRGKRTWNPRCATANATVGGEPTTKHNAEKRGSAACERHRQNIFTSTKTCMAYATLAG